MKTTTLISLLLSVCCMTSASFAETLYAVDFFVTVETEKVVYNIGETVHIIGNLTLNGELVPDALIAIQVNDRSACVAYRTVSTGETPNSTWKINIIEVYLGDSLGNKIANARKGRDYSIWIKYNNSQTYKVQTTFVFTIYDSSNFPIFTYVPSSEEVQPGGPFSVGWGPWNVPADAELGVATVYANAYTDYPQQGGWPHCPEKSGTFNIVSTAGMMSSTEANMAQTQMTGNFYTSFYLPTNGRARLGNYTVYVSTFYYTGMVALLGFNSTIFQVKLEGDLNNDNIIDIFDCVTIALAYGSGIGDENWNPKADVDGNGIIDIFDMVVVALNYGKSSKP